jgi:ethanolamine utilization protein EutQ
MATAIQGIRLLTPSDVQTWWQPEGRRIFIGDVLDEKNSDTMSVGFARYAPGQSNEWIVTYDEALIVTKGACTKVVHSAEEETEVVYVTYPVWMDAQRKSEHAHLLDVYHAVKGGPPDIRPR